jgi:hypothetical protein
VDINPPPWIRRAACPARSGRRLRGLCLISWVTEHRGFYPNSPSPPAGFGRVGEGWGEGGELGYWGRAVFLKNPDAG